MAFSIRNKWFGKGSRGPEIVEIDVEGLMSRIERLERENSDLERTALSASAEAERVRAELDAAKKGAKQLRKLIVEITAQHATAMQQLRHDFVLRVTELETKVTGLTAQRDTAQANFEWARLMFNKGEAERAILTQRIIERPVQPFTIEREAPPPPADGTAGPAAATPDGVDRPRLAGAAETAIGGIASRFGVNFEDVGDDEAQRLGIDHDSSV